MRKAFNIFKECQGRVKYLFILPAIIFVSCEEKFLIEPKVNFRQEFVISGSIDQGPGPYVITVKQNKNLFSISNGLINHSINLVAVHLAQVIIVDDVGNEEECFEALPGMYKCEGSIVQGKPGRAYHVEIQVNNGKIFKSLPDRMPTVKGSDLDVQWAETTKTTTSTNGINVNRKVVQLSLSAQLPQTTESYYLYWRAEELYKLLHKQIITGAIIPRPCFIVNNIGDQVDLFDSRDFISSELFMEDFRQREIDESFRLKHIFSTYQMSISEEYYEYLRKIEKLTENVGSIFDTPKGIVQGNIIVHNYPQEVAHGFFRAVLVDTVHFAIFRGDLSRVPLDPCALDPGPKCFDCPEGSSYNSTLYDKVD